MPEPTGASGASETPVWHVISGPDFIALLRRAAAGEDPDALYLEEYVNADREPVEGTPMSDATTHDCPQTSEPADVHMVKVKRGYTSERLFREVWEPQGWVEVTDVPAGTVLPTMGLGSVRERAYPLDEVAAERARQDAVWGEQNHRDGTNDSYRPRADEARRACKYASLAGDVTWQHILDEEVAEAFAEEDETRLREELVQVAAVAVAWVEAIDRRVAQR